VKKEESISGNKCRASVFIDYRNCHYYLEKNGWEIDWEKFKTLLEEMYDVVEIYYYDGVPSKAVFFDLNLGNSLEDFGEMKKTKRVYFSSLQSLGFTVRKKLVSRVYDTKKRRYKHKCNFDVELAIDAIDTLDRYEVCVLCSGDGDFTKLIKYLKGKHKKVVIMAGKDRLSRGSRNAANQVIHLREVKFDIMKV